MGRGTIAGGGPDGFYDVTLVKYTARAEANISKLESRISELTALISEAEDAIEAAEDEYNAAVAALNALIAAGASTEDTMEATVLALEKAGVLRAAQDKKKRLSLQKAEAEKASARLSAAIASETVDAWCVDLSESLTGEVGTIEIDGRPTQILVNPGGETDTALGKLQPPIANTPAGACYNFAILPWWQKYKPTYRVGVLINVPSETEGADPDTCDVGILPVHSYQGIAVNQDGDGTWFYEYPEPAGLSSFCQRHPDHPMCVMTEDERIELTPERWQTMVDVNTDVNSKMRYEYDSAQYDKLEHWEIPDDSGDEYVGDCEDIALLKMEKLREAGFPDGCLKLAVGFNSTSGHGWLVVLTTSGDWALDMNMNAPWLVGNLPYYDYYWQQNGTWGVDCVRLNNVPVDYMDSGADVFIAGDRVVVRFIEQDWDDPIVIGFESWPRPPAPRYGICVLGYARLAGSGASTLWDSMVIFDSQTSGFTRITDLPITGRRGAACGVIRSRLHCIGGNQTPISFPTGQGGFMPGYQE